MMTKRLRQEISRLQDQLEQERQNNQLYMVKTLEDKIFKREKQFLHSNPNCLSEDDKSRPRTWACPASEKENLKPKSFLVPPPRLFENSDGRNSDATSSEKARSAQSVQLKTPKTLNGRISFDSPDVRDLLKDKQAMRIQHLEMEILVYQCRVKTLEEKNLELEKNFIEKNDLLEAAKER